ncbi:MAG: hypothetical protein EA403_13350 [Spirochaetaceae bacterium]|nr:MAG: hypothetical protein EA403_13350 [Spirochaetaceae bacterium]
MTRSDGILSFRALLLVATLTGLLFGCSSVPKPPETVVVRQNRAAQLAEFGNNHLNRGLYAQALQFFEMSLRENQAVDHLPGVARSHNSIGRVHLVTGELDRARVSFETALAVSRRHGLTLPETQSLAGLGELALRTGDLTGARAFMTEGLTIVGGNDRSLEGSILLHNLAEIEMREGNLGEAVRLAERALQHNMAAKRYEEGAANHYLLSRIAHRSGDNPRALRHARAALAYDKRTENSPGIAQDLVAIGELLAVAGEASLVIADYLVRAADVYRALGWPDRETAVLIRAEALTMGDADTVRLIRARRGQSDE